jgi:hypothetical protein
LAWVYYSSLTLLTSYEFTNWILLGEKPLASSANANLNPQHANTAQPSNSPSVANKESKQIDIGH